LYVCQQEAPTSTPSLYIYDTRVLEEWDKSTLTVGDDVVVKLGAIKEALAIKGRALARAGSLSAVPDIFQQRQEALLSKTLELN